MLHSSSKEGGLLELVRKLEDSEILGINRAVVFPEVRLRGARSTDGVVELVAGLVLSRVLDFQIVEDVLAVLDVCPEQVVLGVVWMVVPVVFRRVSRLALLCVLEAEERDDGRLDLLEGDGVGHLESGCRLLCLTRINYIVSICINVGF